MNTRINKTADTQGTVNPLLKKIFRQITGAGVQLLRNGNQMTLNSGAPVDLRKLVAANNDVILKAITPATSPAQRCAITAVLENHAVEIIDSPEHVAAALSQLLQAASWSGVVAIDTETAVLPEYRGPVPIALTKAGTVAKRQPKDGAAGYALDPRRARVRLLQAYAGDAIYLFDMQLLSWESVAPLITDAPALTMFNAVFDIKMIIASGGPVPGCRIFDTMTAMRLVDGTRPSMLDAAGSLLNIHLPKQLGASDWSGDLTADQIDYAAADPLITFELWTVQRAMFDSVDENAQSIVDEPLVAVARMELAGIPLAADRHQQMIARWEDEFQTVLKAVRGVMGRGDGLPTNTEVATYLSNTLDDYSLASWPRTGKTGALSVAADTLRLYGADVPGLPELMAARRWSKALSTYGDELTAKAGKDGRIHASFLIVGARTGRASSRGPNLQNMPKRSRELSAFREIFRALPGRVIIAADYSQIELRELAAQSGDAVMNQLYTDYGRTYRDPAAAAQYDLHTLTARSFSNHAEPTAEERSVAKAINFSLSYGAGPAGVAAYAKTAYGVEMTRNEARARIAAFKATYPGVAAWQAQQETSTRRIGYVTTLGGRRWRWEWRCRDFNDPALDAMEDWMLDDAVSGYERNYALNHPIQGTAAEIMWIALAYIDRALRPFNARIVAVVHDEVVVDAAADAETVRAVRRVLKTKMTRAWLEFHPEAPWRGLVDVGVGKTWADAH